MLSNLHKSLKQKKMRITEAREKVYEILIESETALSPKEVFQKISANQELSTDQVSVYRNLTLFTELGLTHRFQDGKYSLCKQEHSPNHNHIHIIMTCTTCGKTTELETHSEDICSLATKLGKKVSTFGNMSSFHIQGTCKKC